MSEDNSHGYLQVEGKYITLNGKPIVLKGTAIGGWMNMENFITGYTGHEHQLREKLSEVLGEEKYEYFFDKFLEYFFGEEDAKFFASLGLNCLRIPVNYHHFEDDMNPRVFKPEGFKHLDRVVDICAKHGIYTVIDLHALPGGQNWGWHSDNPVHLPLFWKHKDFQDRGVLLWEHIARHYKDNKWVAGYNPMNEPADKKHYRLLEWYDRIEKAVRAIDPHHILFLDGDSHSADFSHFKNPLPNSVYASHDYSVYGFPMPPELYEGSQEQIEYHEEQYKEKTSFQRQIGGPVWVGEFGPVYQNAEDGKPDWEHINDTRFQVLEKQLEIYDREQASWSIWLYKDIGFQGMTYVGEDTPYIRLVKPFLQHKKRVAADCWGVDETPIRPLFDPMIEWLKKEAPTITSRYFDGNVRRALQRAVRETLLSEEMLNEYGRYFEGKSKAELDDIAKSFSFENCKQRTRLNEILRKDSENTKKH